MKIKGRLVKGFIYVNKPEETNAEIDISAEELARQLTISEAAETYRQALSIGIKPKPTCEHNWEYTSPPHREQRCTFCGIKRIEPEPKPERIDPLVIKYASGNFQADTSMQLAEIKEKINEIINHLTRGKG